MHYRPDNPLIVQNNRTVLLEVNHPAFNTIRDYLVIFAELVKSPATIHTYRITPLSLWNAAARGVTADEIVSFLKTWGKFDIPPMLINEITTQMARYGRINLRRVEQSLVLQSEHVDELRTLCERQEFRGLSLTFRDDGSVEIPPEARGFVKQQFLALGYPIDDLAGYSEGERLSLRLMCDLRPYQREAVEAFYQGGGIAGGSGVLVLPCGAGKTVIGLGVMEKVGSATLILTPNGTSVEQWVNELRQKTTLSRHQIGSYTGDKKEVKPVTVATYQILAHRSSQTGEFMHLNIFKRRDWGLIIYDEVHLLPAPVFRATANLQAKRRLGLTATLVREDGRERDVFSLVGPKKFDISWKTLEQTGWIAEANCCEIRTSLPYDRQQAYKKAKPRERYRIASVNPRKIGVLKRLLERHRHEQVIVIGQYLEQLNEVAADIDAPLITGNVRESRRQQLYDAFRRGELRVLVVSKVANFALDLPDAAIAIQLSGTFGSRQEEAQRLGRILRPKADGRSAYFYSIVSRGTKEQQYAMNRQRFLVEQGYRYTIIDAEEMDEWVASS